MKSLTEKQQLLLATLRKRYPLAFPETPVALKAGILNDIKAAINDFGGNCIKKTIIYYCKQEKYLQTIAGAAPGTARTALDGSPATAITAEHIVYSRKKLARKMQRMNKTREAAENSLEQASEKNRKILRLKRTAFTTQAAPTNVTLLKSRKRKVTLSDTKRAKFG